MVTMTREAAKAAWERAEKERMFWREHQAEYLARYPNRFVAVVGGNVIADGVSLDEILAGLEKQGVEPTDALVRYFNADPDVTFF